jgi:hypothetical protein
VIPASAALLLIAIVGNMPFVGSGLAPAIVTQPQNYEKVTDVSQLLADERLMYLRIDTPGATTGNEIASFVTEYRTATIRGVIVDLRGKANVQYDEFEEQLARETPSNHEQLDAKSSAPLVVLLVDAETTTTTNVQAVLADSDLPAVILSRDHATTDHREFVPFQQTVFGHANDMQLQQAINMLTHV